MAQNGRRYRWLLGGAALLAGLAGVSACGSNDASTNSAAQRQAANKFMEDLAKPDQQMVAVLAMKYGVTNTAVEKLLDVYLTKTDFAYQAIKNTTLDEQHNKTHTNNASASLFEDKAEYSKALAAAAAESEIPIRTAASIIEEYEVWYDIESSQN